MRSHLLRSFRSLCTCCGLGLLVPFTAQAQQADTTQVREATVTAYRPVAKITNGGTLTTVANTPLAQLGSAADLLAEIPGVEPKSGKEGGFEVIGKGSPVIYINGRQVRDLNELKQLRSQEVKSVEVITDPGARYDKSVSAVIRIRTLKRQGEGWGVLATHQYSQGKYAANESTAQLTYRHGGLEVTVGGKADVSKYYWNNLATQITQAPDTLWQLPMGQNARGKQHSYSGFAALNYDVNEHHSFGLRYELTGTPTDIFSNRLDSEITANGQPHDRLSTSTDVDIDDHPTHKLNAYYAGQLGKGTLQVDADLYFNGETRLTTTGETSQESFGRHFSSTSRLQNRLLSGKAAYEWPWLGGQVTVGGQYTHTNRHNDYLVSVDIPGVPSTLAKQREQTGAAFVVYALAIGGRHRLTAGLRYEHASYEYLLNNRKDDDLSPRYDNLFPSLNFSTSLGSDPLKAVHLMLAYNASTQRPNYNDLSNSVVYGNRFLYQSGNAGLRSTTEHNASVTAVWRFIQARVGYSFFKDGIIEWGTSLPNQPNVTLLAPINHDYHQLIATLVLAPQLKWYKPTYTLAYMQHFTTLPTFSGEQRFRSPVFTLRLANTFELPARWRFNFTYRLATPGNINNIKLTNTTHYLGAYVSRTFFHERLTLKAGGEDLLYKSAPTVSFYMVNSRFVQRSKGDSRKGYISLTYQFNQGKSRYKGNSSAEDVIKRL